MKGIYRRLQGFTIVEVVIITPVMLLTVSALLVTLVNLYAVVAVKQSQVQVVVDAQQALQLIQNDAYYAGGFASSTPTPPANGLPAASDEFLPTDFFGPDNNKATTDRWQWNVNNPNSNSNKPLLIEEIALNKPPSSSTRQTIYVNFYGCDEEGNRNNFEAVNTLVYYIRDNKLIKRTLSGYPALTDPEMGVCPSGATSWRNQSCPIGDNSHSTCKASDVVLAENVNSLITTYLKEDGTPITASEEPENAYAIKVTVNIQKVVAGETITYSADMYVKRINTNKEKNAQTIEFN